MKGLTFLGIALMVIGLVGCGFCFIFWANTPSLQPPPGTVTLYVLASAASVACIVASLLIRRRLRSGAG
ncbi:hypothetical protein BN1051_00336 [Arthrobacter saudimassiliensis]|uniref:Lipoprotein n=1 Tax=Arthrobacter saudimassiliensis TaxID=1461584 RepID=A0A078MNQ0_9MICC|nr:hypothetical protein BN1051_00336 [Arthrobacter saudimassiliensis]